MCVSECEAAIEYNIYQKTLEVRARSQCAAYREKYFTVRVFGGDRKMKPINHFDEIKTIFFVVVIAISIILYD